MDLLDCHGPDQRKKNHVRKARSEKEVDVMFLFIDSILPENIKLLAPQESIKQIMKDNKKDLLE